MWDAATAVLKEKCVALNTYIRKERFQIDGLDFYPRSNKDDQVNAKVRRRKEITMAGAKINDTEHREYKKII